MSKWCGRVTNSLHHSKSWSDPRFTKVRIISSFHHWTQATPINPCLRDKQEARNFEEMSKIAWCMRVRFSPTYISGMRTCNNVIRIVTAVHVKPGRQQKCSPLTGSIYKIGDYGEYILFLNSQSNFLTQTNSSSNSLSNVSLRVQVWSGFGFYSDKRLSCQRKSEGITVAGSEAFGPNIHAKRIGEIPSSSY